MRLVILSSLAPNAPRMPTQTPQARLRGRSVGAMASAHLPNSAMRKAIGSDGLAFPSAFTAALSFAGMPVQRSAELSPSESGVGRRGSEMFGHRGRLCMGDVDAWETCRLSPTHTFTLAHTCACMGEIRVDTMDVPCAVKYSMTPAEPSAYTLDLVDVP